MVTAPLSTFTFAVSFATFMLGLANINMPASRVFAASAAFCFSWAAFNLGMGVLGIYPVPYSLVCSATVGLPPYFYILYRGISAETRNKPGFLDRFKFAAGNVVVTILSCYILWFYNMFYTNTSGWLQTLVTLGLPSLKFSVRGTQEVRSCEKRSHHRCAERVSNNARHSG